MKIVLAPDSFKGSLTSLQAATAFEKGIQRVYKKAHCIKVPMADGGEGTVQALVDATGGKIIKKHVTGPLGQKVLAHYGLLANGETAIIEMAQASGLPLLTEQEMNPLKTTTYGTGELMLAAARLGVKKIIVGIGGSATNDGGVGMAQALGIKFLSQNGREIKQKGAGGMLNKIASIDISKLDPMIKKAQIIVACDVNNPLCGKAGASFIFAPQKGATPAMVSRLDTNLKHLSQIIKINLGKDVLNLKGAGAGGGISAGLVAFTNAKLKSGIQIVLEETKLEQQLKGADLVITGEGRVDFQTAFGKTPAGVAKIARKHKIQTIVIGGSIADDAHSVFSYGIDGLESACARDMSLSEAIKQSETYLANAAERVMRLVKIGRKMANKKLRDKITA